MNELGHGSLSARHGETTSNFSGTKAAAAEKDSFVQKGTIAAYKKIKAAAKKAETTPQEIALQYCLKNVDKFENYVRSKGETPSTANVGVIAQAVLLRMNDISVIATAGDLSEDAALAEIQEAESEAILNNTADKDLVLNPDAQAALNCLIVVLLTKMDAATGTGDIRGALKLIKVNSATPVNNAIGDGYAPLPVSGMDLNFVNVATTTDTSGGSSSNFWDILNKISGTASTVAGAIRDVSSSTSGAILDIGNAVQTTGANTGAGALSLYMQRNGITILVIGLLSMVLLILLVRATNRR